MDNTHFPIARANGLVIQEVPNEVLVYDLEADKAHCLNDSAAMVWKRCDGKHSISDIARSIGSELKAKVDDDFVWLAIDQLNEIDLLDGKTVRSNGTSRREVLKKIGMAAVVGLPLVASLAAPKTALAVGSCACVTLSDCNVGTCPRVSCPTTGPNAGFCQTSLAEGTKKKG